MMTILFHLYGTYYWLANATPPLSASTRESGKVKPHFLKLPRSRAGVVGGEHRLHFWPVKVQVDSCYGVSRNRTACTENPSPSSSHLEYLLELWQPPHTAILFPPSRICLGLRQPTPFNTEHRQQDHSFSCCIKLYIQSLNE